MPDVAFIILFSVICIFLSKRNCLAFRAASSSYICTPPGGGIDSLDLQGPFSSNYHGNVQTVKTQRVNFHIVHMDLSKSDVFRAFCRITERKLIPAVL